MGAEAGKSLLAATLGSTSAFEIGAI